MARHIPKRASKQQAELALQADATAIYLRVSTERQAAEGFSLDDQRARLLAYCEAQGWTVAPEHVYSDEGISGKTDNRPAFKAMLEAAQRGDVRRIVAMKLDRLARNVRDFLATVDMLKAAGCDLVLVKESFDTGTPHGKFALTMFAAMAELEAATITERVMTGKRQKATEGGYNGSRAPLGYDYDGERFTPNEHAATVRRIFEEFTTGGRTLSAIAQDLNRDGIPTATGAQWWAGTVKYVLRNGAYAGRSQWDGIEAHSGVHPAIVDGATYEAAVARLMALRPGPEAKRAA